MTTVYVVTSGSYSDYSIAAVFLVKETAEAWIADREGREKYDVDDRTGADHWTLIPGLSGREYYIEEFEAEAEVVPTPGKWVATAWVGPAALPTIHVEWRAEETRTEPRVMATNPNPASGGGAHHIECFGETKEKAHRAAQELRRAIIAGTIVFPPVTP